MLEGEKRFILQRKRIRNTEKKANKNAMEEVAKGLPEEKKLPTFFPKDKYPPEKRMMETLAPNTAALETPKVPGEAMMLPNTVCRMSPDKASPAPAINAAKASGRRILCTMRTEEDSPIPNKAKKDSPKSILLLPSIKARKKPAKSKTEKRPRTRIRFLFKPSFSRMGFILILYRPHGYFLIRIYMTLYCFPSFISLFEYTF